MPAAAIIRGIVLSVTIIAALGIAVLENPQIQEWLEEQRRKLAELLRSVGEELDPESRRTAEAFAFEGRTPANHDGLRREASGAQEAAAVATGRSLSDASTMRRLPIQGSVTPEDAEERRRKGREYLAQRNQQMIELRERRKEAKEAGASTPPTPTFDSLVNSQGMLRAGSSSEADHVPETLTVLPPAPASDIPETTRAGRSVPPLAVPQPAFPIQHTNLTAFERGAQLANPFDDEFAVPDRSETPRPPVPPKVELDRPETTRQNSMPGSFDNPTTIQEPESVDLSESLHNALSYEEQLALALSLSEAESAKQAAVRQLPTDDDAELKAAIAASLREMNVKVASAGHHLGTETPRASQPAPAGPLVDLSMSETAPPHTSNNPYWAALAHGQTSQATRNVPPAPASVRSDTTDDLYTVSPRLTHARLADLDSLNLQAPIQPDHARAGAASPTPSGQHMEASFYSAPSSVGRPQESNSGDQVETMEIDSESEDFRSEAEPLSRTISPEPQQNRPSSALSGVEIISITDDSDVDMLSEAGDGAMTPDSWTEVGSRDGEESEAEDGQHQAIAL